MRACVYQGNVGKSADTTLAKVALGSVRTKALLRPRVAHLRLELGCTSRARACTRGAHDGTFQLLVLRSGVAVRPRRFVCVRAIVLPSVGRTTCSQLTAGLLLPRWRRRRLRRSLLDGRSHLAGAVGGRQGACGGRGQRFVGRFRHRMAEGRLSQHTQAIKRARVLHKPPCARDSSAPCWATGSPRRCEAATGAESPPARPNDLPASTPLPTSRHRAAIARRACGRTAAARQRRAANRSPRPALPPPAAPPSRPAPAAQAATPDVNAAHSAARA